MSWDWLFPWGLALALLVLYLIVLPRLGVRT
jgi:hypothetical protein